MLTRSFQLLFKEGRLELMQYVLASSFTSEICHNPSLLIALCSQPLAVAAAEGGKSFSFRLKPLKAFHVVFKFTFLQFLTFYHMFLI